MFNHKLACIPALFCLASCGAFGGNLDPVIETGVGPDVNALSDQGADRRLVMSMTYNHKSGNGQPALVICAEPSPDAIEAVAASVATSVDVSTPESARATGGRKESGQSQHPSAG